MNDIAKLLTARTAIELVGHEAIVLESYLDSENVWTWGVGVTDKSGHKIERYKDNPSSIERALEIYVWLLRQNYAPAVLRAFGTFPLTEVQFAAALSFHYNTGRIETTDFVDLVKEGKDGAARHFLVTHYTNGGTLTERRTKEAALFFDGHWSNDGHALVIPVSKPSYHPNFRKAVRVDIRADMDKALAA